jgi:hypothetical protein
VNLCAAIVNGRVHLEKLAAAAVFHDLGILTNKTFDYIVPSIALAREYLAARGRAAWIARQLIQSLFVRWPSAGFHWRLAQLTLERFRTHAQTPLPMVKL